MPPVSKIAQRHVVNRLRDAGAISSVTAQPLPDLRPIQARHLHKLVESGVVYRVGTDHYWVDEGKWDEYRRLRRMIGMTIAAIGIGLVALVVWLVSRP